MMRHAPTKTTWHEVVTPLGVMGIIIFLFLVWAFVMKEGSRWV